MSIEDLPPPKTFDEAVAFAEEFAKDAVAFAMSRGWSARYERRGDSFIIFTDGVPTNEIEITRLQ